MKYDLTIWNMWELEIWNSNSLSPTTDWDYIQGFAPTFFFLSPPEKIPGFAPMIILTHTKLLLMIAFLTRVNWPRILQLWNGRWAARPTPPAAPSTATAGARTSGGPAASGTAPGVIFTLIWTFRHLAYFLYPYMSIFYISNSKLSNGHNNCNAFFNS